MTREELNGPSSEILDAGICLHREMGPGLLESVYVLCLLEEFKRRNIRATCEVPVGLSYRGTMLSKEFRIDILVADEIILGVRSVEALLPVHETQVISYLKLAKKRLGFLVNFNVPLLMDGFRRVVNGFWRIYRKEARARRNRMFCFASWRLRGNRFAAKARRRNVEIVFLRVFASLQ